MSTTKYAWDRDSVKYWVEVGQQARSEYDSYYSFVNAHLYDIPMRAFELVSLGWEYPEWNVPDEETFYRIGEPGVDVDTYYHSYNFMDDKPEDGVSVMTPEWLKGTFYDTSDDHIARAGVWELKGIRLPHCGGDDEPLIIPTSWAKRTNIKTYNELLNKLR